MKNRIGEERRLPPGEPCAMQEGQMIETGSRMTDPYGPPNDSEITEWIGEKGVEYWNRIRTVIDENYPGVFVPEWLFGGRKHGWSLRYKKGKSFCTLIPEKDRCALVIVFGAEEREKVESMKGKLSLKSREEYETATTYHDGKWVFLTVDSESVVEDIRLLLAVKRKPKIEKGH